MRLLERGGKFVQSIKFGCELAGLPAGPIRKPLRALDKAQRRELEITIRTLKATVARILNEPAREEARNVVALNA
jgi:4-hydroxy-tetrahydrodipicolinate synthase